MALNLLTSREAVLAAMHEFDELGRDAFLAKHGYNRARSFLVEHDGRLYDSKALAGVAVGYEHPERGPLRSTEFSGGDSTVKPKLEELGFRVVVSETPGAPQLHAWWVNQGTTFDEERGGGYVWAPQQGQGGRVFAHHQNVAQLRAGDIVFHYARGLVRSVGRVREAAREELRPAELPEEPWSRAGYLAPIEYHDAPTPIALEEIPAEWRAEDGGPFTRHGGVKQGYLFPLSPRFVQHFTDEFGSRWPALDELLAHFSRVSTFAEFISWGRRFFEWEAFDEVERAYKLDVAEQVRAARDAHRRGVDWKPAFVASFAVPNNNLLAWQVADRLKKWVRDEPSAADEAFAALWADGDALERARRFLAAIPGQVVSGRGARASVASYLLMGDGAERFPIYRASAFEKAYDLTGHPKLAADADDIGVYEHALTFLDRLIEQAQAAGVQLRDRLDAQAVVWTVTKFQADWAPVEGWPAPVREAFLRYRGELPPLPPTSRGLEPLASSLLLDLGYLQEMEQLVRDRGQLIFFGPPGTGKTYVARQFALHFAGSSERVKLVQFHPSYAYEDFVEGYRPQEINGQPGFALAPGPFKQIAADARAAPDEQFVLIIDEINRGNVAKVFGELYFLLEYRDERITLQYSADEFALPANLWLIGTMNTADRSIALLDAALRRRFYFVPFFPDDPPIRGLLRRWLERNKPALEWVADVVDRANARLDDRNSGIGPSYFMRANLSEDWVELIWAHAVLPYLGEQFFGEEDRLAEFDLNRLRFGSSATDSAESPFEDDEHHDQAS